VLIRKKEVLTVKNIYQQDCELEWQLVTGCVVCYTRCLFSEPPVFFRVDDKLIRSLIEVVSIFMLRIDVMVLHFHGYCNFLI
jgi:hypothetical protein